MNTKDPLTSLLEAARKHSPFGEPGDFGFETRLRSALQESTPSVADLVARFSWRFSFASLPLLLALAAFLAFQQHGQLPEGLGGFVAHWTSYLPVEL
jgi:hypothetical protein